MFVKVLILNCGKYYIEQTCICTCKEFWIYSLVAVCLYSFKRSLGNLIVVNSKWFELILLYMKSRSKSAQIVHLILHSRIFVV